MYFQIIIFKIYGWMNEWMDGLMGGLMGGWLDRWMDGWNEAGANMERKK